MIVYTYEGRRLSVQQSGVWYSEVHRDFCIFKLLNIVCPSVRVLLSRLTSRISWRTVFL